jgi:hypothetical protein
MLGFSVAGSGPFYGTFLLVELKAESRKRYRIEF